MSTSIIEARPGTRNQRSAGYRNLSRRGQIRRLRQLAEHALVLYGLDPVSLSLSLLSHFHNTTFTVTAQDGSRYVLHVQGMLDDPMAGSPVDAARKRARVESELWWMERLRSELQLGVPEVVRTSGGESVVSVGTENVPEDRLCFLLGWMDGHFVDQRLMPRHLELVGRLMARLHEHSSHLTVPAGFDRGQVDSTDGEIEDTVARLFADHWSAEAAGVMRATLRRVRQAQEELGSGPDTFGLIHADIHEKNYLFANGAVRLIDFGDCGWGHYLYDFAVTLNQIAGRPRTMELRKALLAGYRQLRELLAEHEALIDTFIMLRMLQDITWDLQERGNPAFGSRATLIGDVVARLEQSVGRLP